MMSLFVGLRRAAPLAGILGYSGRLIAPELLAERIALAPAGAAGPRHRRSARAVRLDGECRGGAASGRGAGRDARLPRHRARDRPGGAASAAAVSCATCSAGRARSRSFPSPAAAYERFEHGQHLVGIPFGRAFDPADHPPSASSTMLVGSPRTSKALPDLALRVEIDLDLVEPELGDERRHGLLAAAVLRDRRDGQLARRASPAAVRATASRAGTAGTTSPTD